jgi:hypothetical protein
VITTRDVRMAACAWACAGGVVILGAPGVALGSQSGVTPASGAQPAQPAKPAPPKRADQPAKGEPTLDELLGLPSSGAKDEAERPPGDSTKDGKDAAAGGAKGDPTAKDLARRLSPQEVNDRFLQAVELMDEAATRLVDQVDTGLDTQRLQQSIIHKLDQLIDQAQRNQSSSSSSQGQQQGEQQKQQGSKGQRQSSQAQQQSTQPSDAAQGGEVAPQKARPRQAPAGSGAAWGNLPPHVRDALVQGSTDSFSATYQRWTEEYYLRLAREGGAGNASGAGDSGSATGSDAPAGSGGRPGERPGELQGETPR